MHAKLLLFLPLRHYRIELTNFLQVALIHRLLILPPLILIMPSDQSHPYNLANLRLILARLSFLPTLHRDRHLPILATLIFSHQKATLMRSSRQDLLRNRMTTKKEPGLPLRL